LFFGSVSGRPTARAISRTAPTRASTTNVPRQLVNRSNWPPSTGATTGPRLLTSIISDMNLAIARPSNRSRATAIATTNPAATPSPWSRRSPESASALGATAQKSETTT
jgi:hypothetical protein